MWLENTLGSRTSARATGGIASPTAAATTINHIAPILLILRIAAHIPDLARPRQLLRRALDPAHHLEHPLLIVRTKPEIISLLTDPGIIAIVRTQQPALVQPLFEALIAGGIRAIEITMTTPNALGAVREALNKLGERALVGVGTVLDADTCRAVVAAGAEFVVSPICRTELLPITQVTDCPIMLTPTPPPRRNSPTRLARIS
jgi:hypothetical protein